MKRKRFLKLTGLGSTSISLSPLLNIRAADQPMYSFPQMVGEVSQTSAIIQTRLSRLNTLPDSSLDSPKAVVKLDIPGVSGVVRFEISEDSYFNEFRETPWQQAEANGDFIVKYHINELKRGTRYFVRVRFGSSRDQTSTGPISQFKTLPSKEAKSSVSFVVSSCMCFGFFFLGHPSFNVDNPENWKNRPKD